MIASARHGPRIAPRLRSRAAGVAVAGLLGIATGGATPVWAQAVRGLVIGIDEYAELRDLAGAVNDARDVAGALSGAGVLDLVVLEDEAATRERIVNEWRSLLERSERGDTLVLTYAGHGGQEPARVPGTERDGRDEVLLLGGFRSSGPGTRERIFDDEINLWFLEAGRRGLRVVFVADSCHSGTLTRSVDPRAPSPVFRTAPYTIDDDLLVLEMPEEVAALDEAELTHVSFLAAGQEHERVPELALPDRAGRLEPRGALSYMFARAVEGKADIDGDGVLRRDELWRFVRENVRMMSEARQTPNLLPNTRGDEPVLQLPALHPPAFSAGGSAAADGTGAWSSIPVAPGVAGITGATKTTESSTALEPNVRPEVLRLAVLNAGSGILARVSRMLDEVRMVSVAEAPDLIWDAGTREVVTGMGDIAAQGVDLAVLPAVIGKWRAVRAIRTISAGASLRLRVHPHDGVHRRGARIGIEIDGLRQPRLTLLGLSGSGVVHYLYPLPSDPVRIATDQPFRLELEVTPPFGADHVVAVSADRPLNALNEALERLDGQPAAPRVAELLAVAAVEAGGWWSGVQGLFTVP